MKKDFFSNTPTLEKFLSLKEDLEKYATEEAKKRWKDLVEIARLIEKSGEKIAFDLLGSLNFGIVEHSSDVDMVIYLDCEHEEEATKENTPKLKFYEHLILNTLIYELNKKLYQIQIVDVINLRKLEKVIKEKKWQDEILVRFIFYRIICRGINEKILKPYEEMLIKHKEKLQFIGEIIESLLKELLKSSTHTYSFYKYLSRLKEKGIELPSSMLLKLQEYLQKS